MNTSNPRPIVLPDVSALWTPAFVGFCLTTAMYGFSFRQAYTYLTTYPKDPWVIRAMAIVLLMIDGAVSALFASALYYYLIQHFGEYKTLINVPATLSTYNMLTSFIFIIVQLFFVYRMDRISDGDMVTRLLTAVTFVAVIGGFLLSIAASVALYMASSLLDFENTKWSKVVCALTEGVLTFADLAITVSLQYQMKQMKTGFKQTDIPIVQFVKLLITRGVLVLICHAALFATFIGVAKNEVFLLFHQLLPKLYNLTLFTMLLSFEPLRLAPRQHTEDATPTNGISQNIHLEVVQDTETYLFGNHGAKTSPQTGSTVEEDRSNVRLDKLSLNSISDV